MPKIEGARPALPATEKSIFAPGKPHAGLHIKSGTSCYTMHFPRSFPIRTTTEVKPKEKGDFDMAIQLFSNWWVVGGFLILALIVYKWIGPNISYTTFFRMIMAVAKPLWKFIWNEVKTIKAAALETWKVR